MTAVNLYAWGTRATSVLGWGAGCRWGCISANPARKIPYAVRIPNAIDPTDAQTNIARFNKFATVSVQVLIQSRLRRTTSNTPSFQASPRSDPKASAAILAEDTTR